MPCCNENYNQNWKLLSFDLHFILYSEKLIVGLLSLSGGGGVGGEKLQNVFIKKYYLIASGRKLKRTIDDIIGGRHWDVSENLVSD